MPSGPDMSRLFGPPVGGDQAFETAPAPADNTGDRRWRPPVRGVVRAEPLGVTISGHVVIMGWNVQETTGTTNASFNIRNGLDTGGLLVFPVSLSPNETVREWFAPYGIAFDVGYFFQLTSGSLAGSVLISDWSLAGIDFPDNSEWTAGR